MKVRRRYWQPWEEQLLREEYADTQTKAIASVLGRHVRGVYQKAADLGLKKSAEYMSYEVASRIAGGKKGAATRFKTGLVPWNKGKAHPTTGRAVETQFKPGQMSGRAKELWQPIGTYRVNPDGYLDVKVADDGPPQKRWERVHRLVWEQANGPIPEGHIVVFKPGRRTTELEAITADGLECITRTELVTRNSIHRYPPELKHAIRLVAKLKRRIDEHAEH